MKLKIPGIYRPFSELTRASLKHAVAEKQLSLSEKDEDRLMHAYNGLDTFPEVETALKLVGEDNSIDAYVFSNGTDDMVGTSMKTSPGLSQAGHIFGPDKMVTVEESRCFKPSPKTYSHFAKKAGKSGAEDSIWLISSNPFDALGARAAGWQSAWIDRAGTGWVDALGEATGNRPTIVATGVDEAIKRIMGKSE